MHQKLRKVLLSCNKLSIQFFGRKNAVFQQWVLDKIGVLMLWKTRCSHGYLFRNGTLLHVMLHAW